MSYIDLATGIFIYGNIWRIVLVIFSVNSSWNAAFSISSKFDFTYGNTSVCILRQRHNQLTTEDLFCQFKLQDGTTFTTSIEEVNATKLTC